MRTAICAILLTIWAAAASAQTTQPAESGWPKSVAALASVLADGKTSALEAVLGEKIVVQTFDGHASDTAALLSRATRSRLIVARAYMHEPLAMAADIAAAYKTSHLVPDDVKKRMVPDDDAEMQRANATAVQWLTQVLGAKRGEPVGVIVLWCETPGGRNDQAPVMESVFVLVKGQETGKNEFHITQVVYGNPSPGK